MARGLYRDQPEWQQLQEFLPPRLRFTDATAPAEEFWEWRGHDVHLDTFRNPSAPAKVIAHHGVGTNGRQMSLILGGPLARRGWEVVAVDNLGYGLTDVAAGARYDYGDWVELVLDLIAAEQVRDDRPIVLYGLSAGGMLTYHVAAAAPRGAVRGIIGMTFLDQRVQHVRDETAHDKLTSRVGVPAMGLAVRTPLGRIRYPMSLASKMSTLVNDPAAMKLLKRDRSSAANWMSMDFLSSYMNYAPAVEPADFDACPVLLTQPAQDRWTPRELSGPVLAPIRKVSVDVVDLENAGHLPLEDPGLAQLEEAADAFIRRVIA